MPIQSSFQQKGSPMRAVFFAIIFAVATLSTATSFAADERNVTVVNETGYGIKFLGFNPPGDDNCNDNEISGILADVDLCTIDVITLHYDKASKTTSFTSK
jgi:hypothetical protein